MRAPRSRVASRWVIVALMSGIVLTGPGQATADGRVTNPVVEGPIGGGVQGRPWLSTIINLTLHGYVEEEYFFSGEAAASPMDALARVPYKSRMIVRRPASPEDFNGTVLFEWLNVTAGADLDSLWPWGHKEILSGGYAYVAITSQLVGVCCSPLSLKGWDPLRYATLVHPGDDYSYDIFVQGVQAVVHPDLNRTTWLDPTKVAPLSGLRPQRVIASGTSQSAGRMTTYINQWHAHDRLVDAYLMMRGGGPYPALDTPVLQLNEEILAATQEDSTFFRLWQEAGTSHSPKAGWDQRWPQLARDIGSQGLPNVVNVGCSINRGRVDYALDAAIFSVDQWLINGTPPPTAPRLQTDDSGSLMRDENGLAVGGLRYSFIEVPTALNTAEGCPLLGTFAPWDVDKVRALYPTQGDYLSAIDAWDDALVAAGLLRPYDAEQDKAEARLLDAWGKGSCHDTFNADGDEDGPASSALRSLTHQQPTPTSISAGLHDVSCNVVAAKGL